MGKVGNGGDLGVRDRAAIETTPGWGRRGVRRRFLQPIEKRYRVLLPYFEAEILSAFGFRGSGGVALRPKAPMCGV